jgi:hypothetical protein
LPVNAKQICELMALGIDGDVLIKVVAIFDLAELNAKQRSANRSKRYRDNKKSGVSSRSSRSSRDAPETSHDERDAKKKTDEKSDVCDSVERDAPSRDDRDALLLTSLSLDSTKIESKKVRARRKSSVTLRDDWRPSDSHFAAAARMNIPVAKVYVKADDMRLWAKSNDARKADWDATFHGFLRRDADKLSAGMPLPATAEPVWKQPPPEFLERERQRNAAKGTSVRGDAVVGNNGAGHAPELCLSGGGVLRAEVAGTQGDAPDAHHAKR